MSRFVKNFEVAIHQIESQAETAERPLHAAILYNFLMHLAIEFNQEEGRWLQVFEPEFMVPDPVYHMWVGTTDVQTLQLDEIKAFYKAQRDPELPLGGESPIGDFSVWARTTFEDLKIAVADWGFAAYMVTQTFVPGNIAKGAGFEVDDLQADYAIAQPLSLFYPYTPDAQLIGEDVYQAGPATIQRIGSDEVVTYEQRAAVTDRFLPERLKSEGVIPA